MPAQHALRAARLKRSAIPVPSEHEDFWRALRLAASDLHEGQWRELQLHGLQLLGRDLLPGMG